MELFRDLYVKDSLIVASSPHLLSENSTSKIMRDVIIALIPAILMSMINFGFRTIFLALICVVSAIFFEYIFQRVTYRKSSISDLSAVVTGLILAFNLPPSIPYWMAIVGSFIAIIVVKQLFGGIGQNFANPAATARIVLLLSFTNPMTTWVAPGLTNTGDIVSSATPLMLYAKGQMEMLPSNMDMFLGLVGGSMGETSALAFMLGGLFLIARGIISPAIPAAFLGTMFVFSLGIGADPFFHLFAGGAMIGAFFMATDYSTSPMTFKGQIIFGIGCGLITMLIRVYGSLPEGVSFAILFMNIITPHIDNLCKTRMFGGKTK